MKAGLRAPLFQTAQWKVFAQTTKPTVMTKPTKATRTMRLDNLQRKSDTDSAKSQQNRNELSVQPPRIVETVVSSGQSKASSIGIGEFGMNPTQKGDTAAFSVAVTETFSASSSFYRERMHLWTSAWTQHPFVATCTFSFPPSPPPCLSLSFSLSLSLSLADSQMCKYW